MMIDPDSGNFIGRGEASTYKILKELTLLKPRLLSEFPKNGIYKQIPLQKIIHTHDFRCLSEPHRNGSVDIFLIYNQKRIAVRVQGPGHGEGKKHHGKYSLKGTGKVKHDNVQRDLIKKYNSLVDIIPRECSNVFKERVTENAKKEIIGSFKTQNVMIPISQDIA
jgi:hypothetical protein